MPSRFILAAVLLLAMTGVSPAQTRATTQPAPRPAVEPGTWTVQLQRPEGQRLFVVHIPRSYDARRPTPLVLFLHGAGGTAKVASRKYGWIEKAEKENFLVVFGEGTRLDSTRPPQLMINPNLWNDGSGRGFVARRKVDDIGYLRAVLDDVENRCNVDKSRIYCTGFSNGASMTFRVGVELADRVAAIAPVSGHCWIVDPKPARPMSMLFITGTADPLNPINGGDAKNPWGLRPVQKPPIIDSINKWVKLISADPAGKIESDQDGVKITRYASAKSPCTVTYITIEHQGHEWPGTPRVLPESLTGPSAKTLNATDAIWDFFKTQTLK